MIRLPILTDRLTIRRFASGDQDGFLRFMLDEDSTRYLVFEPEQKTAEGARSLFAAVIQSYDTREPIHAYVIADRITDQYLGSCGFSAYDEGIVECYYGVNPEQSGKGIAVEATKALLTRLSSDFEVRAYCHRENLAAHAVARKAGMSHQGIARNKNTRLEGDLFVYAVSARRTAGS